MTRPSRLPFDPRDPLPRAASHPARVRGLTSSGAVMSVLAGLVLPTLIGASESMTRCFGPVIPRVATAEVVGLQRTPDVSLDSDGRIHLAGRPVSVPERVLVRRIAALRAGRPVGYPLTVEADRGLPFDRVLRVVEAATAAGADEVVLLAEAPRVKEGGS